MTSAWSGICTDFAKIDNVSLVSKVVGAILRMVRHLIYGRLFYIINGPLGTASPTDIGPYRTAGPTF